MKLTELLYPFAFLPVCLLLHTGTVPAAHG